VNDEKNISIRQDDFNTLVQLGTDYYVIKGEKPLAPEEVLHRLIRYEASEAYPPEEHNFGRQ